MDYTIYDESNPVDSGSRVLDPFGEMVLSFDASKKPYRDLQIAGKVTRNGLTRSFILPLSITPPVTAGADLSGPVQYAKTADYKGGPVDVETTNMVSGDARFAAARPQSGPVVTIEPDSSEYDVRHKITLRIRVRDSNGNPIPAIFSLAVVSAKRSDSAQMASIADYTNKADSIFVQADADASPYAHLIQATDRMPDSGYVLYDGHSPHRAISLALMGTGFSTLTTDTAGRFQLPFSALVANSGDAPYISVTEKEVDRYKVVTFCKADRISEQLASSFQPVETFIPEKQDEEDVKLPTGPGILKTAVVKAKVMGEYNYITGEYNSKHCETDFVCTHHHSPTGFTPDNLNCPMVKYDSCRLEKPVEGHSYWYIRDTNVVRPTHGWGVRAYTVVYHCAVPYLPAFVKALEPILREKPFPKQDLSTGSPLGAGQQSTVYWDPVISTYQMDEVIVQYCTNDLAGKFICRIQGLSALGPINQSAFYKVRPPKD